MDKAIKYLNEEIEKDIDIMKECIEELEKIEKELKEEE